MDPGREAHWQRQWALRSLGAARRLEGREKFFALVAYPGSSGFLHVGHLRGMLYADAFHRYHRAVGHATFFPTGTHASGLPAVTFARKVQARDPTLVRQLREQGVPESEWAALEDPATAARFLGRSYLEEFRQLGLLVDERAYVTTIDEDYQRFIGWQFRRLAEKGVLVQAPHFSAVCPVCGPVSVDPSETDLSSGGDAEWVEYRTVPFRLEDGRILLAATLRPETVYGVTNLWVHPTETLAVWHHEERLFLVHPAAAARLVEQHGGRIGHEVPAPEVIGRLVGVPLTDRSVPVLASRLVDPTIGTGVVMSVPAHAPADALALAEVAGEARSTLVSPPVLIEIPPEAGLSASERELVSGEGTPAERALAAAGARSLDDTDALEAATDRLYRLEFVRGVMRADLVGGRRVAEAREVVAEELHRSRESFDLIEFSKPVVCRNGHSVGVRRVPDQWFIGYSDAAWKARTLELVGRMRFVPPEYGVELTGILDWFADRPCTRRGSWLGTPFPLDPSWIIEPIADSTFYPAYFVVRPYVRAGRLRSDQLTDAFFDHVFLGRGPGEPSVEPQLQIEVRRDFEYWYPLDLNIGGKEHKRVHFPVFLFTHALLLPPELGPRGIYVHWWLTASGGEKVSKRHVGGKGGAIPPIREAVARWGTDALRLFYATAASPEQDLEWDPQLVDVASGRLADLERLYRDLAGAGAGAPPELEAWLASELHERLVEFTNAFEAYDVRAAAEVAYVSVPALFRRYLRRGGDRGGVLERATSAWVRLLAPITPHLAEELAVGRFDSLVAEQPLPRAEEFDRSPRALADERYLDQVEADLRDVLKVAAARGERPTSVVFFVAAPWKATVEAWMREALERRSDRPLVREVMERARDHADLAEARAAVPKYIERVAPLLRTEAAPTGPAPDELAFLRSVEGYLARRFQFASVLVVPEREGAPHDPLGRRDRARPRRPAFYLVGATPASSAGRSASP